MDQITAKPYMLKQVNLSHIRKVLAAKKNATRAEIVAETGISSTTVRSLLRDMLENKEVESVGYDESSGGRKATRYAICPNRYLGAVFCCMGNQLNGLLVNLRGEIVDTVPMEVKGEQYEEAILPFLDQLTEKYQLKAIGLGIPGIVEGGAYWKKDSDNGELYKIEIGEHIAAKYGIPVILENDVNAIAIGFLECYEKNYPNEENRCKNMVYLYFEEDCISGGLLADGRIVRGYRFFAGELGLVPTEDGRLLDKVMQENMDDNTYIKWMTHIMGWICGILNPQYIALAGPMLREHCIAGISDSLYGILPQSMFAELLYAPLVWHDYHQGMAHLTAARIFETFQVVKE